MPEPGQGLFSIDALDSAPGRLPGGQAAVDGQLEGAAETAEWELHFLARRSEVRRIHVSELTVVLREEEMDRLIEPATVHARRRRPRNRKRVVEDERHQVVPLTRGRRVPGRI